MLAATGLPSAEWWGAGMVICLERGADYLHIAQLMPLPLTYLLLQIGFTRMSWKKAVK